MGFLEELNKRVLLFDGAMGTEIHKIDLGEQEWGGYQGCNEYLSISAPERIAAIYRSYLDAGSDVIETNTFGAQKLTLEEHGLANRTEELNRASAVLARRVLEVFLSDRGNGGEERYIAGSMGPGTKLPSLGHTDFDSLHDSYLAQARGLIAGGVDLFIVETAQDPLQIKAAVLAIRDAQEETGADLPVVVSITVETNGSMLVGTDIAAAVTILEPLAIDVLGINCATGPAEMRPHVKELAALYTGPVFAMPNAGFPEHKDGRLIYDLGPEEYRRHLISFVQEYGVDVIGGCCGTDPSYIAELRKGLNAAGRSERSASSEASLASLYSRQELRQDPGPFFVGERTNTNGSKKFREHLLEEDWHALEEMGKAQQRSGAHGIDVCLAYAGRDERSDMREIIGRLNKSLDRPIVIDSTDPLVIEDALKLTGGRPLINSVNLEEGPGHARRVFSLAKRYGAAIIALTIDEKGMARSLERKLEVAGRLVAMATGEFGLRAQDMVIDPLTFTLGSGESSLKDAGRSTIEALRRIKEELPGVHTVLGVSNTSYGLSPHSREVLNSMFLHEAVEAGLDLAIVNVRKITPLHSIPQDDRDAALDLIYHRGKEDPLLYFIRHFDRTSDRQRGNSGEEDSLRESLSPTENLRGLVIDGVSHKLEEAVDLVMEEKAPEEIISEELIPSMKQVGEMFGEGEIQLPFVLQSAEVMKKAVDYLEPHMSRSDARGKKKVVLATVRGDVHDIGKNLVDIILTNNGYEVYNLGIKIDVDSMIEKIEETDADAVGMSGLLVKSTGIMKENLEFMKSRGIDLPVLLGGAALTEKFVQQECAPLLESPVFYCRDAFDGLHALSTLEGSLDEGEKGSAGETPSKERGAFTDADENMAESGKIDARAATASSEPLTLRIEDVPSPPHWRIEEEDSEDLQQLFSSINFTRLVRGRWGYRSAYREGASRAPAKETDRVATLTEENARGLLENLRLKVENEGLIEAKARYRWLPCRADGDSLEIFDIADGSSAGRLDFPRGQRDSRRCVSDFFIDSPETFSELPRGLESRAADLVGLQIVSLGPKIAVAIQELFSSDRYREYLLLHGLAVELTEVYAELIHRRMEEKLGIGESSRFSVGYPCCPQLELNRIIAELLGAEEIGVSFTTDEQMVPEFTTSAFLSFHPEAYYFSI